MSVIELQSVSKSWGDTFAMRSVSFTAEAGQFLVLLGPSGCGKSTTLRVIAGLESVGAGRVLIGGEEVTHLPPAARHLSMVFQSYALFPHLSTRENILFGLKVRKVPAPEREQRLQRVAELVGLTDLLARKPSQLSGGQRQRVALARALIAEHPICLMDEPLSNLDAQLRQDMRVELRDLQQRLGMTVVYVTHDQTEAMSMADKVVLMRDGQVEQEGAPNVLYEQPATLFAARFIGSPPMNLLDFTAELDELSVQPSRALESAASDTYLGLRPEDIEIHSDAGTPAELVSTDYLGADTLVTAQIDGQPIRIRQPGRFPLEIGRRVYLRWAPDAVHHFDKKSGRRLTQTRSGQSTDETVNSND